LKSVFVHLGRAAAVCALLAGTQNAYAQDLVPPRLSKTAEPADPRTGAAPASSVELELDVDRDGAVTDARVTNDLQEATVFYTVLGDEAQRTDTAAALESARSAAQASPGQVCGTVKITTTDTVLHALVAPALKPLQAAHPLLSYERVAGNELDSLTRRDADIAVRATRRPPAHLVGKHVGPIRVGLFTARKGGLKSFDAKAAATASWIAPDDALPEHPSVRWRKKHFPMVQPRYRVNSILTVAELVGQGMGIGLLPLFLAHARSDLRQLGGEIEACQTELWLLTHADTRHLRRVSAVYGHLARHLALA